MNDDIQAPQYVKDVHPFAKIPALRDGPVKVLESRAICKYLVAKYAPEDSELLLPTQPVDVAAFEQAMSLDYSYFDPNVAKFAYEKIFKKCVKFFSVPALRSTQSDQFQDDGPR